MPTTKQLRVIDKGRRFLDTQKTRNNTAIAQHHDSTTETASTSESVKVERIFPFLKRMHMIIRGFH
ncbi:hypothetical protein ACRALDRAFT_1062034 [Sodiomyces alcalophilus JCM 7366]|uniref:uncharacterized protein n=1 Tax=Sodiomyces alcalophilus JCM 7366 TaxID=591952 RepID=UPI0039B6AA0A